MQKRDHNFEIQINLGTEILFGDMYVPSNSKGMILFAHGSGSSRLSSRNRYVAKKLNEQMFGTLLFDLLTQEEDKIDNITLEFRFNIPLLAKRLISTTDWLLGQAQGSIDHLGYFGASTGSAAALIAAAKQRDVIKAVVSRGGRPDLASTSLQDVIAPTLLIVGGLDLPVIQLNQEAHDQLVNAVTELSIIPGATHLFEEPGKLDEVVTLACAWFNKYL